MSIGRTQSFLLLGCLGGVLGPVLVALQPARYAADASIMLLDAPQADLAQLTMAAQPLAMLHGLATSTATKRAVARDLGLDLRTVEARSLCEAVPGTNMLHIRYEDRDPTIAIAGAKATLVALEQLSSEVRSKKSLKEAAAWRNTHAMIQNLLRKAEQREQEYLLTMTAPPKPEADASLAGLLARRQTTRERMRALEQELSIVKEQAKKVFELGVAVPTSIPHVEAMRAKLRDTEFQLAQKSLVYGEAHPDVQRLRAERGLVMSTLKELLARYLESVNSGMDSSTANLLAELNLLRAQEEDLSGQISAAGSQALELQRLHREVLVLVQLSSTTRSEMEKASVAAQTAAITWSMVDQPGLANYGRPINRSWSTSAVLGAASGLLLAWILARRRGDESRAHRTVPV